MDVLIQLLINGIMLGSMYAIISVGLTLIFGVIRVVNFAHGELLMIGMYAVYLLCTKLGLHPYVAAFPVIVLLFLVGVLIQRFIIQPLLDADEHIQIFATVGLSTALVNLALMVFGADLYSVTSPDIRVTVKLGTYNVLVGQLVMLGAAVALVVGLHAFM
jgi:branched-chain amino acid transport system permease protein